MPEAAPARDDSPGSDLRRLLVYNLGLTALIFVLLELWRPLYFLTDDNLDCFFPIMAGIGRRLLDGQSPFVSDYIFGGNYNILRDCSDFLWHPVYLLAALVANSPARLFSVDLIALIFLMLTAAGFVCLAHHLREQMNLRLSDARLTLYTQSFTYSMIILCVGPSWVNYLGNHSAMPWLALGILQTNWRRGLALVSIFSLHHLLAGHLEITISATLFFSLFACCVAFCRRSWLPLLTWVGGYAIALILLSPLIYSNAEGFLATDRAAGLKPEEMSTFAVPAMLFPASYFFSTLSVNFHIPYAFGYLDLPYSAAFVSCAAAWAIIPALTSRCRWGALEILCLGIVALAALLVMRPLVLSQLLVQLPLVRSLRWPFREIVELQFFLHLFFVLRPLDGSPIFRWACIWIGVLIFIVPLPFRPAPSFNLLPVDRYFLFSGYADKYWAKTKTLLAPGDVIVPVAPPAVVNRYMQHIPLILLGTGNYPILFQVRSATGYSPAVPRDQLYLQTPIRGYLGFYSPEQKAAILAERPNVRFITLESLTPARITLSSHTGPPIDLTAIPLPK